MNIFIAGGSGAIGRQLVPMLAREGHHVVAMTRSPGSATRLEAMGATPVIGDVFDKVRLDELVEWAEPELVIHQLTAFGATDNDPLAERSASVKRVLVISLKPRRSRLQDAL